MEKQELEAYITRFIEAYKERIRSHHAEAVQHPPFYKGQPCTAKGYMLQNGAAVILFRYGAAMQSVEAVKETWEGARSAVRRKEHDFFIALPPTKGLTAVDAEEDSAHATERDVRSATYRVALGAARTHIGDTQTQLDEVTKTNPWLEKQLKEIAARIASAKEPLLKLDDELGKVDREERFLDDERTLGEMEKFHADGEAPQEGSVGEYLKAYIETYSVTVKAECPEVAYPAFFRGAPLHAKGYILPNEAVLVLFRFNQPNLKLEVRRESYDAAESALKGREHSALLAFPPGARFRKDDAAVHAKIAVKNDVRQVVHRILIDNARNSIGEEQKAVAEIVKTNPWLEKPLTALLGKLAGVRQLLDVLHGEVKKGEEGKRYTEHEMLFAGLKRCRAPSREETRQASGGPLFMPAPGPVYETPAYAMPPSEQVPIFMPGQAAAQPQPAAHAEPQPAHGFPPVPAVEPPAPAPAAPPAAAAEVARIREEILGELNFIKSSQYNFEVRLDDYEKRLNYMDKYMENLQKQQNEKFKVHEEKLRYEASKAKHAAIGMSIGAIALSLIVFVIEWDNVVKALSSLTGG